MSAWQVTSNHVATMVDAAILFRMSAFYVFDAEGKSTRHEVSHETREKICAMLAEENLKSLRHRYDDGHEAIDTFPRHPSKALNLSPVALLKAIQCYEYQSCEHDGWRKSDAFAFCGALKDHLIGKLPGYDAAETWGIS